MKNENAFALIPEERRDSLLAKSLTLARFKLVLGFVGKDIEASHLLVRRHDPMAYIRPSQMLLAHHARQTNHVYVQMFVAASGLTSAVWCAMMSEIGFAPRGLIPRENSHAFDLLDAHAQALAAHQLKTELKWLDMDLAMPARVRRYGTELPKLCRAGFISAGTDKSLCLAWQRCHDWVAPLARDCALMAAEHARVEKELKHPQIPRMSQMKTAKKSAQSVQSADQNQRRKP